MAESPLRLNIEYFNNPEKSGALGLGLVYVGKPDLDPEIEANRVTVTIVQEDGTRVPIAPNQQPLTLNAGGNVDYLGSSVPVLVNGIYSVKVLDLGLNQKFYVPFSNEFPELVVPFDNVAEMIAAPGDFDGQQAYLGGYYDIGDGGNGPMYWDATSTETADNVMIFGAFAVGRWKRPDTGILDIRKSGAKDDNLTDISSSLLALDSSVSNIRIVGSTFKLSTNTTISANLIFEGGKISIDTGITLNCGSIIADNSTIIFEGLGTVKSEKSTYSLGWYSGLTADVKWDFLRRGLVAGYPYHLIIPQPKSSDVAAIDNGTGDGYQWKLAAPMEFGDPENFATIELYGGFSAEPAVGTLTSMWHFGNGTKTEMITLIGKLRLRGTTDADVGLLIDGGGHIEIPFIYGDAPSVVKINASTYSSNDIKIGHIYGNQGICLDAQATTGRITELDVGFIDSDGGSTATTDCLVRLKGGIRETNIGNVSIHAVVVGFSDCSDALVLIENNLSAAPSNGIKIGKVTNRSTTITSDGVRIKDTTSGVGSKSSFISVSDVDSLGTDAVDAAWVTNIKVDNPMQGNVRIASDVTNAFIDKVDIANVIDAGERTRINGKIIRSITLSDDTASSLSVPSGYSTGIVVSVGNNTGAGIYNGIFYANTTATPVGSVLSAGSNFAVTTGLLSGTTGTDTNFTVSARGDGKVYFENRTGAAATFIVEFSG